MWISFRVFRVVCGFKFLLRRGSRPLPSTLALAGQSCGFATISAAERRRPTDAEV
jgi:hypothetical protein